MNGSLRKGVAYLAQKIYNLRSLFFGHFSPAVKIMIQKGRILVVATYNVDDFLSDTQLISEGQY